MPYDKNGKKLCVLVVEDEPMLLLMAIDLVEEAGFEAIGVPNADKAIGILESVADIRIVFTDVDMPPGSMNGLKMAILIRDRWPPIEIILTSGHMTVGQSELPSRGRFFAKPYDAKAVARALHEMAA